MVQNAMNCQNCHNTLLAVGSATTAKTATPFRVAVAVAVNCVAYLAALDVHRLKLFGRCEAQSGIASFDRLVAQALTQDPYRSARRVFWIMDNGSSHRGQRSVERLQNRYPNLRVIHGPLHASWLNQIKIYFSIIQRKVLTPNDFSSLEMLADRLEHFERHYEVIAKPFERKFTRDDLTELVHRLHLQPQPMAALLTSA